jgi:predicted enzyme related to lactoylglutathione lyase
MASPPSSQFAFTKLVVANLEEMAAFYCAAYGLRQVGRVRAEIGTDRIDEIMLGAGPEMAPGALVLLRFVDLPAPRDREALLGFTTDDLPALVERVCAAGGTVHAPPKEMPEMNLRVAFVRDPEGHLAELVQLLG